MQIVGLNRALVSQGLKIMSMRKNMGLRVLSDVLEITDQPSVYQQHTLIKYILSMCNVYRQVH